MSTVATGLTGPQTTGGSSSGGDTFGNVFTDAVTAIGAYIARSRAAELATVGAEDAGITATDVAIASVAAVPGLLTGDIAGSIAGGAAALGVGLTALDPLTAPFVAVAALYVADQGTESLLKDLQRLAGGKSPQPSQRRPVRSYSNYSGTTSEVVTNTADWESATVTGHVSETSADNHFARTFDGKSSNGATTLYQQSAGTYKSSYSYTNYAGVTKESFHHGRTTKRIAEVEHGSTLKYASKGSVDNGKTTTRDAFTMKNGVVTNSNKKSVYDYGRSTTFTNASKTSSTYGYTYGYGKTTDVFKNARNGTPESEYFATNFGETKTYLSASLYERYLHGGETKTYATSRSYDRSVHNGRTLTYDKYGATSYHSQNYGESYSYQRGATSLRSENYGESYLYQHGQTVTQSRGFGLTVTRYNGRTYEYSINGGETYSENNGTTFLTERGGGQSFTYRSPSEYVQARNYGATYFINNGHSAFAYSPTTGGTYLDVPIYLNSSGGSSTKHIVLVGDSVGGTNPSIG